MKKFWGFREAGVTLLILAGFCGTCYGEIPHSYWQYQEPFANAAESADLNEVVRIGKEIIAVFADKPMDKDKASILNGVYDKLDTAYEQMGQYDEAIEAVKKHKECSEFLGYADSVKLDTARIKKIDPMPEVYLLTDNASSLPYFGSKWEPKQGAYFGRVYTDDGVPPLAGETAMSFYVECFQENLSDFDWYIRQFANGNRVLHIALNMPGENTSLQGVLRPEADAYLNNLMTYLNSLNCPVLLRIGGEMNVWNNLADPDTYKAAFQKIASLARAKAQNVALVFSPNDISVWSADIDSYYPGDAYVDWVGVSLYTNLYWDSQNPVARKEHEEMYYGNGIYANPITKLRDIVDRYGNKKPIMITEGGFGNTANGMDLTNYAKKNLTKLYTYVNMVYPQVKAVIYFDETIRTEKTSYAISKNQTLFSAYEGAVANNPSLIKKLGEMAPAYVKAENYADSRETLTFAAYADPVKGADAMCAKYFLNGELRHTATQAPFTFSLPVKDLAPGQYPLTVVLTNNSSYEKTKEYWLVKKADGQVQVTKKAAE